MSEVDGGARIFTKEIQNIKCEHMKKPIGFNIYCIHTK